jgi:hypothetical protein
MLESITESDSHIFDEVATEYEDEFFFYLGKNKNQAKKYSIDLDRSSKRGLS